MQEKLTQYFNDFAQALTIYDYLGFAILGLLFILCVILALLLRAKAGFALFFATVAFILLVAGPFGVKYLFDKIARAHEIEITKSQKLVYSNSLVIDASLTNKAKIDFSHCKVTFKVYVPHENRFLDFIQSLQPIAVSSHTIDKKIQIAQNVTFNHIIDEFEYEDPFSIQTKGACYP
ncbi:MAG: DUF2393 family protein [Campylobacterota bacterium]